MRLRRPLDQALASPARVRVLRELVVSSPQELTGRELSRHARVSHTQCQEALAGFESAGFVRRRADGRSQRWGLETENALVPTLRTLFEEESRLPLEFLRDIRASLAPFPLRDAALFGSIAREEETEASDADLFLEVSSEAVARDVRDRLFGAILALRRKYGVWLSPLIYTTRERRHPPNPTLVAEIARDRLPVLEESP